jgi:hypothetical protein
MSRTYLLGLPLALFLSSQATAQTDFDADTDRRSQADYRHFLLREPEPQLCSDACFLEKYCRSWTFVNNPHRDATCYLGNQKRKPVPNHCCTSGTP